MLHATPEELRLVILAVTAAAGADPPSCAAMFERATDLIATAPAKALDALATPKLRAERFAATRILASVCGACAACPRGEDRPATPVMAAPRRAG